MLSFNCNLMDDDYNFIMHGKKGVGCWTNDYQDEFKLTIYLLY